MDTDTCLSVVVNEKSIWADAIPHTLVEWKQILVEQGVTVSSLSPYGLTEENFSE